jgi:glycosyltransferase involved in cell wall biosynthesis
MEILDGGIWAENRLFNRLEVADAAIERQLTSLVQAFDIIITMGSRSARFLRERGATAEIHVIPGGVDPRIYRPSGRPAITDLIFVGRLAPIKQLHLLLDAIEIVQRQMSGVSLTVVGEGELRSQLEASVHQRGLTSNVTFAGQRTDVSDWIAAARVFVLTSKTEGVSLSLMESFASGVPAVVTDVGDLADLVVDGVNGFLVPGASARDFAARLIELLGDEPRRRRFAAEALRTSHSYQMDAITARWDFVLRGGKAVSTDAPVAVRDGAAV